jgi:SAM-dependent methyltransferase
MDTEASVPRQPAASRRRPAPPPGRSRGSGRRPEVRPAELPVRVSEAQRVRLLLALAAPVAPCRCLLVTRREESAELRDRLFEAGGDWSLMDMESDAAGCSLLPFPGGTFDRVVVVDVRAAMADPVSLDREVARVLAPGGAAIVTEPKGREGLARGRSWGDLRAAMLAVGLRPVARAAHSGFFATLADAASEVDRGRTEDRGTPAAGGRSALRRIRGRTALLAARACMFLDRVFRGRGGATVIVALKDG